jgi:hypothetical protein
MWRPIGGMSEKTTPTLTTQRFEFQNFIPHARRSGWTVHYFDKIVQGSALSTVAAGPKAPAADSAPTCSFKYISLSLLHHHPSNSALTGNKLKVFQKSLASRTRPRSSVPRGSARTPCSSMSSFTQIGWGPRCRVSLS